MKNKKQIFLSPPHMDGCEFDFIKQAFESNYIAPLGPHVDAFELEMCEKMKFPFATALCSGTAALHLALIMAGVGPGDEVICSTLTFIASANAISYCGASPIFIDSSRSTWTMDPDLLEEEVRQCAKRGKVPKALIVVDIYGQCADYNPICRICQEYGIILIEDAAESLGATYGDRFAGVFGSMGVLSFNGNKIITTSGGGMLVASDKRWTNRARFLSTQARDHAPHYEHSTIGYNYRMSNLLAALGRGQLQVLDKRIEARRAINDYYRHKLSTVDGLSFMPEAPYGRSNCWLTVLLIDEQAFGASSEAIRIHLQNNGIEARPVWKPMHLQPLFAGCRFADGGVSEDLFKHGLCLPSGSSLCREDLDRIISTMMELQK